MFAKILDLILAFFGWHKEAASSENAVNRERLREAEDANAQVTAASEARARVRDDLAIHPERVRDANGDARPFRENGAG